MNEQQLQEKLEENRQWISLLSRDAKMIINNLIAKNEILEIFHDSKYNDKYINIIRETKDALKILNNMFDNVNYILREEVYKNKDELLIKPFPLSYFIDQEIKFVKSSIPMYKKIKIIHTKTKELNLYVKSDFNKLSEILRNILISSSQSITIDGYLKLDVKLLKSTSNIVEVEFVIESNGDGLGNPIIDESDINQLDSSSIDLYKINKNVKLLNGSIFRTNYGTSNTIFVTIHFERIN